MKHKLIAMTAAFLLSITPLTANALTEPVVPSVADGAVFFPKSLDAAQLGLIVSSNQECTVTHAENGCTFTPEEDGRYVVSAEEFHEEIVSFGTFDAASHFHYFYPVLTNYTVDVEDGEITVTEQGSSSWFSEKQIDAEVQKMNDAISAGETEVVACYDVYAADPDNVLNVNYFSFVNGQLPDGTNGYDSYITNLYSEYGTVSNFCVNYFSSDVATTIPLDRVTALEQDISSLETITWASSWCSGDLDLATDDYMEFSRIAAPESDGDLTVIVDGTDEYPLTVEDGIFHHRKAPKLMGDCNNDGTFSVTDIVMMQKYLLCTGDLTAPQNADICADGVIDAFDLAVMKRELLRRNQNAEPMLLVTDYQITLDENGWGSINYVEVLDSDGFWHVQESDTNSWEMDIAEVLADASAMIQNVTPSGNLTDAERDEVQAFLDTAPQYEGTEMTVWDLQIEDYGQENLYIVYPDGNGGYLALELCRFGGECAWLDNAQVQAFVTMLIENGYFADSDTFEWFLENQT